ncbi:MAG: rod shape-determining protein, partial [Ruminococcaceae bacterium]|nr:rod shape-determining protein [Oscillospiraceae bacterium]
TSADIRAAIKEPLSDIVHAIRATLETTPPELTSDIYDSGIVLSGGGARLRGIDTLIREKIGVRVMIAKNPLDSVCAGIGKIIESEGSLGNLLKYRGK